MTRIASVLGLTAAAFLAAACATTDHQTARQEAAATLAQAQALQGTNAAEVVGKASMAWGDRWTAANLFERAAASRASVGKRFNLAVGYHSTGRLQQAAAIYRSLLDEGQYTYAYSSRDVYNRDVPVRRFNVADEAARRLAVIALDDPTVAALPSTGALAAGDVGVDVSAVVGGARAPGRVSDAEAIRLDELAPGLR